MGTTIATATASDPENNTLTYSLSGTGSDKFTVDSNGNVTLASALDYETATSYSINLNVSDGANTVTDVLNINVGNVAEFSYSGSLVSSTQAENISTGTVILNSSVSGAEGTVSYSLSDPDNKFAINSSTGEVTLANALDYEVKTSHSFTVSVTDGSSTTSNTFTLSLSDVSFGSLVTALASSSFQNLPALALQSRASRASKQTAHRLTALLPATEQVNLQLILQQVPSPLQLLWISKRRNLTI